MKYQDLINIIPAQISGKEIEVDASIEMRDQIEGKQFYQTVKGRLLRVNSWHQLAGVVSAEFQLVDSDGLAVDRNAIQGDYIRIDIPGPGSTAGDGYDWVRIEELKEVEADNNQSIGFRVRPAKDPGSDKNEVAHFYSEESTSVFIVTRESTKIIAWIIDSNVSPGVNSHSITGKIRDITVGLGAVGIFSKLQWQNLVNGLVRNTIE